jgi:hypothetical protein
MYQQLHDQDTCSMNVYYRAFCSYSRTEELSDAPLRELSNAPLKMV